MSLCILLPNERDNIDSLEAEEGEIGKNGHIKPAVKDAKEIQTNKGDDEKDDGCIYVPVYSAQLIVDLFKDDEIVPKEVDIQYSNIAKIDMTPGDTTNVFGRLFSDMHLG